MLTKQKIKINKYTLNFKQIYMEKSKQSQKLDIRKHTTTCAFTDNLKHNLLNNLKSCQETIVIVSIWQLQTLFDVTGYRNICKFQYISDKFQHICRAYFSPIFASCKFSVCVQFKYTTLIMNRTASSKNLQFFLPSHYIASSFRVVIYPFFPAFRKYIKTNETQKKPLALFITCYSLYTVFRQEVRWQNIIKLYSQIYRHMCCCYRYLWETSQN